MLPPRRRKLYSISNPPPTTLFSRVLRGDWFGGLKEREEPKAKEEEDTVRVGLMLPDRFSPARSFVNLLAESDLEVGEKLKRSSKSGAAEGVDLAGGMGAGEEAALEGADLLEADPLAVVVGFVVVVVAAGFLGAGLDGGS